MSASQGSALTAVAFQLVAALETYEQDMQHMVARWLEPELYQKVARDMDLMRLYAATLAAVSVPWVELLIRHFEATHGLWRLQKGELSWQEVEQLHENLKAAVQRLRQRCLQLLANSRDLETEA